jgi:hypothetical protein
MSGKSLNNISLYSSYFLVIYCFISGFIDLFFAEKISEFLNLNSFDSSRYLFFFTGGLLIFQIYRTSKLLFIELIDTFIIMLFILSILYPLFCVFDLFIFNLNYLFFLAIHFLLISHLLYDKNR